MQVNIRENDVLTALQHRLDDGNISSMSNAQITFSSISKYPFERTSAH
jgi:hypothetical protein